MNVKENFRKVKDFVGAHRKDIALGAVIIVSGVAVYKLSTIKLLKFEGIDGIMPMKCKKVKEIKIDIPESLTTMVEEISGPDTGEWFNFWLGTVKLSDLGKLGEELCKIDGFGPDSVINGGVNMLFPDAECMIK